jgi:hypothetical protein
MIRGTTTFVIVFLLHSLAQFLTLVMAANGGTQWVWKILSVPLFQMLPHLANEHLWMMSVANSLVWATVASLAVVFGFRNSN